MLSSGFRAAALIATCAIASPAFGQSPSGLVPPTAGSLLERDDLTAVVDLQTRRDTAALVALLDVDDAAVRARAALALGSVRVPGEIGALSRLLRDPDPTVRAFAAFALGQSGNVLATAPLLDALQREGDPRALTQVLHALGRVGDRPALATLAGLDVSPRLEPERALAIARLGIRGVHDPRATRLLAGQLTERDPRIRRTAAYYFGRVTETGPWTDVVDHVANASRSLDPEDEAQLFMATALGRLQSSEHESAIVRLLRESRDWRIRVNAARALGGAWRSETATATLMGALDDGDPHVSAAAAAALPEGPLDATQLDHLERRIRSGQDSWHVWTAYLPALAADARTEAIAAMLASDLSVTARAAAIRNLAADDSRAGLARLIDATAHPDPRVAAAAVAALRQVWQRQRERADPEVFESAFVGALRRGEGAVVFAAAGALADTVFLTSSGGDALREAYHELSPVRSVGAMEAIVRAHSVARDTAALDFLVQVAVGGRHPVVRRAATAALTERFGEGYLFTSIGGRAPSFPDIDWDYLRSLGSAPRLVLETDRGTIVLRLETEWAPGTVATIARFAEEGRYDGVEFHRVVPNFVIQGGDFGAGDGFGGPDFLLPSELTPLPYSTGTLGMASSGPDTEGSQFFVTHSMQPHLDANYTVFGSVLSGQAVVDQIRAGDRVVRARVESSR